MFITKGYMAGKVASYITKNDYVFLASLNTVSTKHFLILNKHFLREDNRNELTLGLRQIGNFSTITNKFLKSIQKFSLKPDIKDNVNINYFLIPTEKLKELVNKYLAEVERIYKKKEDDIIKYIDDNEPDYNLKNTLAMAPEREKEEQSDRRKNQNRPGMSPSPRMPSMRRSL